MKNRLQAYWKGLSLDRTPPETIALTIVLGLVLGVFPLYGVPTVLCFAAALICRTHAPLLQAINAITSPLQLALLVPFHTLGARVVNAPAAVHTQTHLISTVFAWTERTIAGWFLMSVPAGIALYCVVYHLVQRRCYVGSDARAPQLEECQ